jgi:prolyl 4-hydroxylase
MQLPPQIQKAHDLVAAGRGQEAVGLLNQLAASGDGPACFELAEWAREGQIVAQDFSLVRSLYARAAQAGLIEALRRFIALVAVGIGGPRDWQQSLQMLNEFATVDADAAEQLALLGKMQLSPEGDPTTEPVGEVVRDASPRVLRFPGLFSAEECRFLSKVAEPLFEPAPTVEEYTGRLLQNPIRTSDTAIFPWVGENPAIHALNRRMAAASRTDVAQGEPLQILRYQPGQEYKPHTDAVPGLENQRIMTMLVYLNDDFEGGETCFLEADLTIRPKRGEGLLFMNVDAKGEPDPTVLHSGLPVTSGVKFLASRWIRERAVTA